MRYGYKGIDNSGNKISGKIDADDLEGAKLKLKSLGIIFSDIKPSKEFLFSFLSKKPSDKELALFLQDLALYLKSGVTIASAIKLCKTQYENDKKFAQFLNTVYTLIIEGSSFYVAIKKQSVLELPSYIAQTIKVAEERGFLYEACYEIADFLKKRDEIAANTKKAIAYPAFIIVVSIALIAVMLTVVTPIMADVFSSNNQALPPITTAVLGISNFFSKYKIAILMLMLILLFGFSYLLKTNSSFKYKLDALILKLPFLGRITQTGQLARFLYVTAMLNKSGVPLAQSLRLSTDTLDNGVLKQILLNSCNKVVGGARLSSALAKEPAIDKALTQALFLGEESGQTIDAILALSQKYQEENKRKTEIALALLEPILMVIVGAIVGVIVAAMLLPIVSISIS